MLKKLSLAALVALGSVSVASATPLTDAIKNVDLSGMLRIRYYNEQPGDDDANTWNKWRTNGIFVFKVPVDEHIKFVYRASVQTYFKSDDDSAEGIPGNNNLKTLAINDVDTGHMNNLLFMAYSNGPLNAIIGKIPVKTPITSADPATPGHGAGAIVTYNVGNGLTVAAGYVDAIRHAKATDYSHYVGNTEANSIYTAAAIYSNDLVDAQLWYFHINKAIDSEFVLSANVKALKDYGVTIKANYATSNMADADDFNIDGVKGADLSDKDYFDITVKYDQDALHALIGYASASDDDGVVTTSVDSPLGGVLPTQQRTNIANDYDTDAIYAMLGYDVTSALNVSARYANFDGSDDNDADEYVVQADYKYNKKLSFQAYYSVYDADNGDTDDKNE
ncbi:MAG: major outer membrane protein, partial [Nautiliaceae bacterium]